MAGRKRESGAWKLFDYDEKIDKTACLVKLKTGKLCTMLLSGKNSTNLKVNIPSIINLKPGDESFSETEQRFVSSLIIERVG